MLAFLFLLYTCVVNINNEVIDDNNVRFYAPLDGYIYMIDKSIFPRTMLELLFLLNILVMNIYNEFISDIQC